MVSHGFFFRAPLLSFLPLGCSCFVGVLCVPCSSLLYILLVTVFFCLQVVFLSSIPVSGSLPSPTFCLFGFVPFLLLPRLHLLRLAVGSSWCVSSYGFVVGGTSYFLFLCFGCFLLDFLRVFTSCFRFLGLFSSWRGFAAVWYCRRGACCRILPVYSLLHYSRFSYSWE